jgi:16S rRNA U516 pseudouridylate synthase RsuA-like enzyme
MRAAVEANVERLVRVRIGSLRISGLLSGQWRNLRPSEVASLVGERRR